MRTRSPRSSRALRCCIRVTGALLATCGSLLTLSTVAQAAALPATHPTVWACRPDVEPNPCLGSLKTSYLSSFVYQSRKVARVDDPPNAADPKVDCFFVYPTVSSVPQPAAPLKVTGEIRAILQYQAARFSQDCRVFAPVYRQITNVGITLPAAQQKALAATAYSDVLGAWRDYLAHDNHGRGVVFIGHSQGTGMLLRLLREEIEPDPAQLSRVVSAILPGSNLTVPRGELTGGDLKQIPICTAGEEAGCAIAYSSFGTRPALGSSFGRPGTIRAIFGEPAVPGAEAVCTNPAQLNGDGERLDTFTRTEPFPGVIGAALAFMFFGLPPKANTPWVSPGEHYSGRCVTSNGAHVLMIRSARPGTIVPLASPAPGFGLHLADVNLPLGNLVGLVAKQIAAYEREAPATAGP
jgi:hypothetical protein